MGVVVPPVTFSHGEDGVTASVNPTLWPDTVDRTPNVWYAGTVAAGLIIENPSEPVVRIRSADDDAGRIVRDRLAVAVVPA